MIITDLQSLRDAIKEELNRFNETDDRIDGFIQRAQSSIVRVGKQYYTAGTIDAHLRQGSSFAVFDFTGATFARAHIVELKDVFNFATQEISGPGNPIEELANERRRQLFPLSGAQLQTQTGRQRNVAGPPTHYTSFNTQGVDVDRPADQNYLLGVSVIWIDLIDFSDPSYTTSMLRQASDVYLYGALKATAPFYKDDERMPMWKALFDEARAELDLQYERTKWPSTPVAPVPKAIGDFSNLEQF